MTGSRSPRPSTRRPFRSTMPRAATPSSMPAPPRSTSWTNGGTPLNRGAAVAMPGVSSAGTKKGGWAWRSQAGPTTWCGWGRSAAEAFHTRVKERLRRNSGHHAPAEVLDLHGVAFSHRRGQPGIGEGLADGEAVRRARDVTNGFPGHVHRFLAQHHGRAVVDRQAAQNL